MGVIEVQLESMIEKMMLDKYGRKLMLSLRFSRYVFLGIIGGDMKFIPWIFLIL